MLDLWFHVDSVLYYNFRPVDSAFVTFNVSAWQEHFTLRLKKASCCCLLWAIISTKYIAIASHYDKIDKNVKSHDALRFIAKNGKNT